MSIAQHTPGPWKASKRNPCRIVSASVHRETANRLIPITVAVFERVDDAVLGCGAPELLAALRALVLHDENERAAGAHGYSDNSPTAKRWNRARAAIAKVTGSAP